MYRQGSEIVLQVGFKGIVIYGANPFLLFFVVLFIKYHLYLVKGALRLFV